MICNTATKHNWPGNEEVQRSMSKRAIDASLELVKAVLSLVYLLKVVIAVVNRYLEEGQGQKAASVRSNTDYLYQILCFCRLLSTMNAAHHKMHPCEFGYTR